jgi:adenylate cyclase
MPPTPATICKGCWQQMHVPVPIRGLLSLPFRLAGIRISRMNPNLCNICETMFTRVKRRSQIQIEATVLFADVRGYTSTAASADPAAVAKMLDRFYDICADAVWERDGIINKFIGDAVLAIFNFPLERPDHVEQAVGAGLAILDRTSAADALLHRGATTARMGIGVGIHTGTASIGEFGTAYKDFTIIGPVVNLASRVQGIARAGELLVTSDVYRHVADAFPEVPARQVPLKGIDRATAVFPIRAAPAA